MTRFSRHVMLAAALLLAALLLPSSAGAAWALDNEYTPSEAALAALSPAQAQKILTSSLPRWDLDADQSGWATPIARVTVGLSRIDIVDAEGHGFSVALDNVVIATRFATFWYPDRVEINNGIVLVAPDGNKPGVQAVTDALYVLHRNLQSASPQGDAAFAQVVANYRAANPKPALPEEARRFEVQAEAAIKDGDFADAAGFFDKALNLAPWWAGGHYNRAAVLVEIGEYQLAIAEMQRYLLLAPDAPDARASQDKIYEWQRQVDKAAVNTSSPPPSRAAPF